jgi:hypothetical protein
MPSRAAAAAARRTALLIESRLRLPEIAKIGPKTCAAGSMVIFLDLLACG